jgi:hypothetical protein
VTVQVRQADLVTLVMCTVRYALGRRTYIVDEATDMVRNWKRELGVSNLRLIARDIRGHAPRSYGSSFDRAQWMRLLEELEETTGSAGGEVPRHEKTGGVWCPVGWDCPVCIDRGSSEPALSPIDDDLVPRRLDPIRGWGQRR